MGDLVGTVVGTFKAIELDPTTRQRTGQEHVLAEETRGGAIDALLRLLDKTPEEARIDPTRTLVQVGAQLWTIVAASSTSPSTDESASLRRAGAKHRRVR